jgi:hypothetical protein
VEHGVVVVTSLVGAVIHGLGALEDPDAADLSLTHLGKAVPLCLTRSAGA